MADGESETFRRKGIDMTRGRSKIESPDKQASLLTPLLAEVAGFMETSGRTIEKQGALACDMKIWPISARQSLVNRWKRIWELVGSLPKGFSSMCSATVQNVGRYCEQF